MKLTKTKLKQIIKEEIQKILSEGFGREVRGSWNDLRKTNWNPEGTPWEPGMIFNGRPVTRACADKWDAWLSAGFRAQSRFMSDLIECQMDNDPRYR